jgi:hypothetical protein
MHDIVVNNDLIDEVIEALDKEIEFVNDFVDSMYTALLEAASHWQGASYTGYASMMGKYSNYFFSYAEMIEVYLGAFQNVALEAIETLEGDVKKAMTK